MTAPAQVKAVEPAMVEPPASRAAAMPEPDLAVYDDLHTEVHADARNEAVSEAKSAPVPTSSSNWPQPADWVALVEKLHVRGLEAQLARQSELVTFTANTIELRCESRVLSSNPIAITGLEKRLNAHFTDQTRRLKVQQGRVQATPAIEKAQVKAQELAGAYKLVAESPTINALIQELDGMLVPSSVQAG